MHSPSFTLEHGFKLSMGTVAWLLLLGVLVQVGAYLLEIVALFGIALLGTYILLAPVNVLERLFRAVGRRLLSQIPVQAWRRYIPRSLPRLGAILMVYLFFATLALILTVRFVPVAMGQLAQFTSELPRYTADLENWLLRQPLTQTIFRQEIEAFQKRGMSAPTGSAVPEPPPKTVPESSLSEQEKAALHDTLFAKTHQVTDWVSTHLDSAFNNLMGLLSTTATGVIYGLTGLVLMFYFLLDGTKLKEGFLDMLRPQAQPAGHYLISSLHDVMFGFVKGQVLLGLLTGAYMIVIYSIFDVPYAFFLGAFFALAEILPVVGTWLGFTPGILVLLVVSPMKLLVVMGLVYVFQVIKDNILAPRVVGSAMGLHPVIVILSLLICAKVAGLVGVLFALPLASAVNVLIRYSQDHARLEEV